MKYGKFIEVKGTQARDFQFIVKGISDDETRYFMNFAYCEDNKLISTDGRRLHILDLQDNPLGFENKKLYRALKSTTTIVWFVEITEDVGQFPNYKRVDPELRDYKTIDYYSAGKLHESSAQLSKLLRAIPEKLYINLRFLYDLPKNVIWNVRIFQTTKALVFISGSMKAVIMPMEND